MPMGIGASSRISSTKHDALQRRHILIRHPVSPELSTCETLKVYDDNHTFSWNLGILEASWDLLLLRTQFVVYNHTKFDFFTTINS